MLKRLEKFFRMRSTRDIDGLVSLFEPDAVLVPDPGKIVSGADALRETFTGVLATGARFERVKLFSLHRVKDIALATAEWNQLCRFRNWSSTSRDLGVFVYQSAE